jgi:hypothetical protein
MGGQPAAPVPALALRAILWEGGCPPIHSSSIFMFMLGKIQGGILYGAKRRTFSRGRKSARRNAPESTTPSPAPAGPPPLIPPPASPLSGRGDSRHPPLIRGGSGRGLRGWSRELAERSAPAERVACAKATLPGRRGWRGRGRLFAYALSGAFPPLSIAPQGTRHCEGRRPAAIQTAPPAPASGM